MKYFVQHSYAAKQLNMQQLQVASLLIQQMDWSTVQTTAIFEDIIRKGIAGVNDRFRQSKPVGLALYERLENGIVRFWVDKFLAFDLIPIRGPLQEVKV